ncbi:MAG: hypothetical protein JSW14_04855 [Candidatus Bathyarchaeum sp.]|nr:MAG: hypothetical protein JSW14_04855 [Candidatus Bathyarchaeum sp.]
MKKQMKQLEDILENIQHIADEDKDERLQIVASEIRTLSLEIIDHVISSNSIAPDNHPECPKEGCVVNYKGGREYWCEGVDFLLMSNLMLKPIYFAIKDGLKYFNFFAMGDYS